MSLLWELRWCLANACHQRIVFLEKCSFILTRLRNPDWGSGWQALEVLLLPEPGISKCGAEMNISESCAANWQRLGSSVLLPCPWPDREFQLGASRALPLWWWRGWRHSLLSCPSPLDTQLCSWSTESLWQHLKEVVWVPLAEVSPPPAKWICLGCALCAFPAHPLPAEAKNRAGLSPCTISRNCLPALAVRNRSYN